MEATARSWDRHCFGRFGEQRRKGRGIPASLRRHALIAVQPERVPESGSWRPFLFDPSLALGQLALCCEKPSCYHSPGAEHSPQEDSEVAEDLSYVQESCVHSGK